VGRDLDKRGGVVDAPLKTGSGFGVHAEHFLRAQVSEGLGQLFGLVHDDHFSVECRDGHQLDELFTDMMNRI